MAPAGNAPASRVLQTRANLSQLESQSELTLTCFCYGLSFQTKQSYHSEFSNPALFYRDGFLELHQVLTLDQALLAPPFYF